MDNDKPWWEQNPEELVRLAVDEVNKNKDKVITEQEVIEDDAEAGYCSDDD